VLDAHRELLDTQRERQAEYGSPNYNVAFAQQGAIGRFFELGLKYTL
jgi:hypothetical protein